MSTIFGYCRVSTLDQDPTLQSEEIRKRHPGAVIREEKGTATKRGEARPVLELLLEMMEPGDRLVVWKLDRLARNLKDLLEIVAEIESRKCSLEVLDQAIDTATASGKAFLQMLGVFAEFETNLRRERQVAGIERAKLKGRYKGRRPSFDYDEIRRLRSLGLSYARIAAKVGCTSKTAYRVCRNPQPQG